MFDDASLVRQRLADLDVRIQAIERDDPGHPSPTMVVQIVDVAGITTPATPLVMYGARRAVVSVPNERVGAPVTIEAVGDWFPVAHIGPKAPSPGDLLFATLIGDLWVTRKVFT